MRSTVVLKSLQDDELKTLLGYDLEEFYSKSILVWFFIISMNEVNDYQLIQSAELPKKTCIPKFPFKIFSDLKWKAFHNHIKVFGRITVKK